MFTYVFNEIQHNYGNLAKQYHSSIPLLIKLFIFSFLLKKQFI